MVTRSRRVRKQRGGDAVDDNNNKLISHIRNKKVNEALVLLESTDDFNFNTPYRGSVESDTSNYYNLLGIALKYNNLRVALALIAKGSPIEPTESSAMKPLDFTKSNIKIYGILYRLNNETNLDTRRILALAEKDKLEAAEKAAANAAAKAARQLRVLLASGITPPSIGGSRKTRRRKQRKSRKHH